MGLLRGVATTFDPKVTFPDETLNWSRVERCELVGVLYEEGLKTPLLAEELAAARRRVAPGGGGLLAGDPVSGQGAGQPRRRQAGGRAPRGRGRGRGRSAPSHAHEGGSSRGSNANAADDAHGAPEGPAQEPFPPPPVSDGGSEMDIDGNDGVLEALVQELCGDGHTESEGSDNELVGLASEDIQELAVAFDPLVLGADVGAGSSSRPPELDAEANSHLLQELAGVVGGEIAATSLEDIDLEDGRDVEKPAGSGGTNPSSEAHGEGACTHSGGADLVGCVGPSVSGYVSLDGRAIGRIIRGKPASSLSVRCYQHPKCSFLLPIRFDPGDPELLRWLIAVPPAQPDASPVERKALADQHVDMSKRWRQKPQKEQRPRSDATAGRGASGASSSSGLPR